ncbi:MAG: phosphoglycerate kinase [Erysipelotrichia bacterium]|nr:phosphoglycerate kinase [Erysipelotrichia bacterium]
MLTVKEMNDLEGKRVIVRVDFNVPLKEGAIRDDNRIVQALPTIKDLIGKGARVILLSHLGKVQHKLAEENPAKLEKQIKEGSLAPVAARLSELLNKPVVFIEETRGDVLIESVNDLQNGEVLLLQNTRYEDGEEKNDVALSNFWASLGDAFVMDAFGSAHRAHASTYGIPEILKAEGKPVAVGYLVEKEVANLNRCVDVKDGDRPYIAILGGLKVSGKIKVIESLLNKCDKILIGGAMAFTFLKALGHGTGNSPVEDDQLAYAKNCYVKANGRIILPVDTVVSDAFDPAIRTTVQTVSTGNVAECFQGLDIGPKTRELFAMEIARAKMVFWNGPMGVFEQEGFQKGTIAICEAIAKNEKAFTVCGGGDSAAAAKQFGYMDDFSHVSTGGGAALEMIENDGRLPGIDVVS